jgi:NADPH:quinone reductase-like Zn-dependent oxidoreductase
VTCGTSADANPQTDIRPIFWDYLKVFGSTLGTREDFRQVLNFLSLSRTKPLIDQVFSLQMPAEHSNGWQRKTTLEKLFCAWTRNPYASHSKRKIRLTLKR